MANKQDYADYLVRKFQRFLITGIALPLGLILGIGEALTVYTAMVSPQHGIWYWVTIVIPIPIACVMIYLVSISVAEHTLLFAIMFEESMDKAQENERYK